MLYCILFILLLPIFSAFIRLNYGLLAIALKHDDHFHTFTEVLLYLSPEMYRTYSNWLELIVFLSESLASTLATSSLDLPITKGEGEGGE